MAVDPAGSPRPDLRCAEVLADVHVPRQAHRRLALQPRRATPVRHHAPRHVRFREPEALLRSPKVLHIMALEASSALLLEVGASVVAFGGLGRFQERGEAL